MSFGLLKDVRKHMPTDILREKVEKDAARPTSSQPLTLWGPVDDSEMGRTIYCPSQKELDNINWLSSRAELSRDLAKFTSRFISQFERGPGDPIEDHPLLDKLHNLQQECGQHLTQTELPDGGDGTAAQQVEGDTSEEEEDECGPSALDPDTIGAALLLSTARVLGDLETVLKVCDSFEAEMTSIYCSGVVDRAAVARMAGRLKDLAETAGESLTVSSKVVTEVRAICLDDSYTRFHLRNLESLKDRLEHLKDLSSAT